MSDQDYVTRWRGNCKATESGCWIWQLWCHPKKGTRQLPYAEASYRGRRVRLHRQMLAIKLGRPVGDDMHACHTCDVPQCINPEHLFEATNLDNQRDMIAKGRHAKQVSVCKRGHSLAESAYYYTDCHGNTHRRCRECERGRWQRDKAKRLSSTVGAKHGD